LLVNLFMPTAPASANVGAYVARLRAAGLDVDEPRWTDDAFGEKLEVVCGAPPAAVSFTFGCPDRAVIGRVQRAGSEAWVTVTTVDEARAAAVAGADALVVQGSEAGGHRGAWVDGPAAPGGPATQHGASADGPSAQHGASADGPSAPHGASADGPSAQHGASADGPSAQHGAAASEPVGVLALLQLLRAAVDLPLVAAGGIATAAGTQAVLDAGASLAAAGTAFMLAPEAGTAAPLRAAVASERPTALTRAFTGRLARGIVNDFMTEHGPHAPSAYPEIHYVTAGLRKRARETGDESVINLWAGQAHALTVARPAAETVAALTP
jgi:nitronate monooxygenase